MTGQGTSGPERPADFVLGYRPVLDGLRGLAVLAVMAYHSELHGVVRGGFLGVEGFFVLSGFLITVLLVQDHQRSGSVHLRQFYLRRLLRLLPALLVMVGACCAFAAFRTRPERARDIYQAALLAVCYGANWDWFWSVRLDLLGHTWSLSVEEQFYLLWPPLLALLLRLRTSSRALIGLTVVGMAGSALLRAAFWLAPWPAGAPLAAASLAAHGDFLLAGCLVGLLAGFHPWGQRPALRFSAGIAATALVCLVWRAEVDAPFLYLGGFTLIAVAAAVVLAALVTAPACLVTRVLGAPALVWVGRLSYGLYLWHFPMVTLAPKLIHGFLPATRHVPGLSGMLPIGLAFAAAALSYYGVERPFLRWKDTFRASSRPSPRP